MASPADNKVSTCASADIAPYYLYSTTETDVVEQQTPPEKNMRSSMGGYSESESGMAVGGTVTQCLESSSKCEKEASTVTSGLYLNECYKGDTVEQWPVPRPFPDESKSSVPESEVGPRSKFERFQIYSRKRTVDNKNRQERSSFTSKEDVMKDKNLQHAAVTNIVERESVHEHPDADISQHREGCTKKEMKGSTESSLTYNCALCSKFFESNYSLKQRTYYHIKNCQVICKLCKKTFPSGEELARHSFDNCDGGMNQCNVCKMTLHRKKDLDRHKKIHSAERGSFLCKREGCDKEYKCNFSLRKHEALHVAKDGNMGCMLCGELFDSKNDVVQHIKDHVRSRLDEDNSDKKYACNYCGKKFSFRSTLSRHVVVHAGPKDLKCQYCPKKYGSTYSLARHIQRRHPRPEYPLKTCGRGSRTTPAATVVREPEVPFPVGSMQSSSTAKASMDEISAKIKVIIKQRSGKLNTSQESSRESASSSSTHVSYFKKKSLPVCELPNSSHIHRTFAIDVELSREASSLQTELLTGQLHVDRSSLPPTICATTTPKLPSLSKGVEESGNVEIDFPSPGLTQVSDSNAGIYVNQYLNEIDCPSNSVTNVPVTAVQDTGESWETFIKTKYLGESGPERNVSVFDSDGTTELQENIDSALAWLEELAPSSVPTSTPTSPEMMTPLPAFPEAAAPSEATTTLPRFNDTFRKKQPPP